VHPCASARVVGITRQLRRPGALPWAAAGRHLVDPIVFIPLLLGLLAAVALYLGYRAFWRKRLIENIPTSKCDGVCIGLTEVKGQAQARRELRSFLAERRVVFYRFTIEERWRRTERYRDKDGKTRTRTRSGWRTVRSGERRPRFRVADDTGSLRVDPDRAEVDAPLIFSRACTPVNPLYYGKGPRGAIANSTFQRRFREWAIADGEPVYILGTARIRDDIVEPEIAHDPTSPMFIVSTRSEAQLIAGYQWQSVFGFLFAVLLALFIAPTAVATGEGIDFGHAVQRTIPWMILSGLGVVAVIAGLYMLTVYNGLIDLRNRARRAWSMIDIELKRRHDLIPNLVHCVKAVAAHERRVFEAVTARRLPSVPGTPSEAGARAIHDAAHAQSVALSELFAVAEAYPTLQSDRAFRSLTEQITRCENRIALMRSFYNDSVERLNTRVESVPDRLFAAWAGAERKVHIHIEDFESKPIEVSFTEAPEPEQPAFRDECELEAVEVTDEMLRAAEAELTSDEKHLVEA
jgi:hypothetical protein